MATVTIPQKEYAVLVEKALRFEYLRQVLDEDFLVPPPTRNKSEVLKAFRATGKYSLAFLKSLGRGLARSSYFTPE